MRINKTFVWSIALMSCAIGTVFANDLPGGPFPQCELVTTTCTPLAASAFLSDCRTIDANTVSATVLCAGGPRSQQCLNFSGNSLLCVQISVNAFSAVRSNGTAAANDLGDATGCAATNVNQITITERVCR